MGVLEDAIREHIELRRRHGAAEDELRDQEAEALGPARREDEQFEAERGGPVADSPDPADEPTRLTEVPAPRDEPEPGPPFDGAATGETAFEDDEPRPEPVLEDEPFVIEEPEVLHDPRPEEPVTEVAPPFEEPFGDGFEEDEEEVPPTAEVESRDELAPEDQPT